MVVEGAARTKDTALPCGSRTESSCDAVAMLNQTTLNSDSKKTTSATGKDAREDATASGGSCDNCSDSIRDEWASISSIGHPSTPETPPEDSTPRENDSEYAVFPYVPQSVDCPVLNQASSCELVWDQSAYLRQQSELTLSTIIHAAWALVVTSMTSSSKVGFCVTGSGTSESSISSLRLDCTPGKSIQEYLEAIQSYKLSPRPLKSYPKGQNRATCRSRTLIISDIISNNEDKEVASTCNDLEGYSLILKLRPQGAQIHAKAVFDSRFLEPWLAPKLLERLQFHMQQLFTESPEKRLEDIGKISPADLQQIWKWNGILPAAVERCMHHMFQDLAVSQPCAPAIDAWDGKLTYLELDQLSKKLAGHLVGLGIKSNVIVPLCFEKSMWMPVAMMGVLKAGGAFSLLEPSFPEQRLKTIVEELHASVILCSSSTTSLSSRLADTIVQVNSNTINSFVAHPSQLEQQSASSLMFAVFTSGSTGKPKGALLTHINYASALTYQVQRLGFTKKSRVFDFASYAFDVSVHNVFATLTLGACLCIPSDQARRNDISKAMADMQVTIAHLTPSVTRLIEPAAVPLLQTMIFTGEPLPVDDAVRWWGKVDIVNEYGPAECTINTVNNNPASPEAATSIGAPVGVVGWIVDPELQDSLVPIGCTGELLVEGPLVGRGYINDASKTAAAFIENPKWLLQGAPGYQGRTGRLYKTGDLVRYNENGSLSFLGRKDVQVKIHGQRVDLGEVEHWVQSCVPEAEQVVAEVVLPEANKPIPTLVAFIQSQELASLPNTDAIQIRSVPAEIQVQLTDQLPPYAIPTVFFWLNRLPMTPTGKMNRKELRDIGASYSMEQLALAKSANRSRPQMQPSLEMEQRLREIWGHVLSISAASIGLEDNFFQLGGDSIASMKAVAEARELGIEVTVADIFYYPSLYDLAQHCHQALHSTTDHVHSFELFEGDIASFLQDMGKQYALDPTTICDAYPCTKLQEGLIFLTSKRPGDYIEQSVLELAPGLSLDSLCEAWEQVAEAMPILRTRLAYHNDFGLLQLVLDNKAHWMEATGLEEYLRADRERSMNLGEPLSRFALVKDESKAVKWLVWTIHHAIYDGWSIQLIMDAVAQAYEGGRVDQGPQFQTFIKYVQAQDDIRAADYWQNALEGFNTKPFPPLLPHIEEPVADSVVEHSFPNPKSLRTTTSILIRAAWALVVGRMANANDVVFGSTLYGRNAAVTGLDKMVAPTIATVPVRVRFKSAQKVSEYLETVHREAAEMMPYEQTGLQKISSFSQEAKKACQFQTHLVIQPESNSSSPLGKWASGSQEKWFSTYALTLEIWLGADGIFASAMFDSRMIESWAVKNMLRRLEWVIYQLDHATPTQKLSDIAMSTTDDLEQIWQLNQTVPKQINRCVQDLLADQVQTRPEDIAICAWDGELTYRALDKLSTNLSTRLRSYSLENRLVPLCFEKSMWTAVAMLGVLKTNAGFIMLDPHLPEERLRAIIRQVNSDLIVTCPSKEELCSRMVSTQVVPNWDLLSEAHDSAPALPTSPSSVAYAIFTSGSTGAPKGVLISHANAVSAQAYQATTLGLTSETRLLDFASYSFDVSISNIFSTIACGGCLCIPSENDRKNYLEESIVSFKVNALDLTPSTLQLLSPDRLPGIRLLTLGGEPLRAANVSRWCGKVRICNAYGPSECTPTSTINCNLLDSEKATHIGKGAGAVTWIVDPDNHNELLPPGCIGELLLEGPLVGPGYLNDLVKTAACFIEDPEWLMRGSAFQGGRQGRLYKTGDLVKYNGDGSLAFVGRKDAQLKVRGQRVEPAEIETVLLSHKDVLDAAVVLQSHDGQDSWLTAFVTIPNENDAVMRGESPNVAEPQAEKVQYWEHQFDEKTYFSLDEIPLESIGRDFVGWTSMYDGSEIHKGEMNEWLDDTIDTILNGGSAGHVLEIGTGSGMMLFNLANHGLESYTGIEPSERAVEFVTKTARSFPALADKVHILKGTAEDVLGHPVSPTLVIINSVIQYFPGQAYLFDIIRNLVDLGSVESIFLGDVRSYALHQEFLATRTLHIAKQDISLEEFTHILRNLEKVEPELLVDPGFFTSLPDRLSRIRHVEIIPKRMKATNELSSYRYAVVLHIGPQNEQAKQREIQTIESDAWIDYESSALDRSSILNLLSDRSSSAAVAISNIPNRKISYEREIVNALESWPGSSVNWLSLLRQNSQHHPGLSAYDLTELAQEAGYEVEISWARQHSLNGGLDAVFYDSASKKKCHKTRTLFHFPTDHHGRAYHSLSSEPLRQRLETKLQEELKKTLQSLLPSYMVPRSIVVLEKMPINASGKIDRHTLSESVDQTAVPIREKRQPSTAAQIKMQAIWSKVLNMEPSAIGLDDGFIQLGGSSIGAMKVVNMAREAGIKLEVADMYRHSTTSIHRLFETEANCNSIDDSSPRAIAHRLRSDIARHDSPIESAQLAARTTDNVSPSALDKQLTVALTGATGFIGTQILRQLLEDGRVGRVIAIVRGLSASEARKRTIDAAKKAQWWTEFHEPMLEVWPGDLTLPNLGISQENWHAIEDGVVDIFIHNGATVHFMKSYAALEAANVSSTAQVLQAGAKNPNMKIVYVSSARHKDPNEECEDDMVAALAASPNGYNETKVVAEALVRRAAARSSARADQFAVVSPGLVVGTPTEGVANSDDWIWRMAAACIRVGMLNADESDSWIPIADAASTAATIVHAAFDGRSPVVTQVKGGMTMGEFWEILKSAGYTLRGEDGSKCMAAIHKDIEDNKETHPLSALADMTEGLSDTAGQPWASSWYKGGFASPIRLRIAVSKSVKFLNRVGLLPNPAVTGGSKAKEALLEAFKRSGY